MPGAGFKTFTAGSVLTASDVNTYLMQQAVMTFTNEAARDLAITSPSEGMVSYLTSPTTPSAAGTAQVIPSGVRTIYNGSVWVCVTPVSAYTPTTGTTTATSYGSALTSGGVNPSVTMVTGTTAWVTISAKLFNSTANKAANMSVGIGTAVTGSSVVYVTNNVDSVGGYSISASSSGIITGLTPGTNTFQLLYSVDSASTGSFADRSITVCGVA